MYVCKHDSLSRKINNYIIITLTLIYHIIKKKTHLEEKTLKKNEIITS